MQEIQKSVYVSKFFNNKNKVIFLDVFTLSILLLTSNPSNPMFSQMQLMLIICEHHPDLYFLLFFIYTMCGKTTGQLFLIQSLKIEKKKSFLQFPCRQGCDILWSMKQKQKSFCWALGNLLKYDIPKGALLPSIPHLSLFPVWSC